MLTGRPLRIARIRANRSRPGLAAQHLSSVRVAARYSRARVAGAELGSPEILFQPGGVTAGDLREEIGTAGSTSLVLQTVALPLCLADGPSRVSITGGTHVPWSPTTDFLQSDWCPLMDEIGLRVQVRLLRPGYYPKGGGEILVLIPGGGRPRPLERKFRGNLRAITGKVFLTDLSRALGEKVTREARRQLRRAGVAVRVEPDMRPGTGQGIGIHLVAAMEGEQRLAFTSLGAKGKPAERVAREAVNALFEWLDSGSAMPPQLADQALLPLSFAGAPSVFTTSRVTSHLVTNAEVVHQFRVARIRIAGKMNEPGEVTVEPLSPRA
jgi:RNA 3'-terminal phosphate cyclase (ATP)